MLVVGIGPGWALAVDAATFGVSAAFLAMIPMPAHVPVESHSFLADLRDGWDDFRSRTWLWTTVASTTFGNMMFAAYFVLGPLVAELELGGAGAWALIASAFGVGLLVGGLVLLQLDPSRPVLVATLARRALHAPARVPRDPGARRGDRRGALLAGAGLAVANNLWETTQQRHVPPELLSRVTSYDWFGSLAAVPIGMLLWGPISDQIGVSTALWIAFALQLASILALLAVREIRELPAHPPTTEPSDSSSRGRRSVSSSPLARSARTAATPPFLKSIRPPVRSWTTCEKEGSWPTTSTRASAPCRSSSSSASSRLNPSASESSSIGSMFSARQASRAVSSARTFGLV